MAEAGLESDSLHHIYRICVAPLQLWEATDRLLKAGANVNHRDDQGWTPLSSLLLHVNRGLRWHPYRVPGLGSLEDLNGEKTTLEEACQEFDSRYQEQVKRSLNALISSGASVNMPLTRVPAVVHSNEWIETFEHKLIQSEFRWNLLFTSSMEFSTYSAFNPLTKYCVPNSCDVTMLHLASWRGDAQVLALLLSNGADASKVTVGGRTALHFLYLYCNNPSDLVACTRLLVDHGVDIHSMDTRGRTALHLLLTHCITKRSHVMYLANSYNGHGVNAADYDPANDHFNEEINECIEVLLDHGALLDLKGKSALITLYEAFEHSLEGCDEAFQTKGHYLVPYQFTLRPILDFSQRLIHLGSKVNERDAGGQTSLHKLVTSIQNLNLNKEINPPNILLDSFRTLLNQRVHIDAQDRIGRTAVDYLIDGISSRLSASLPRYLSVLNLFFEHGANLNKRDCNACTCLHRLLSKAHIRQKHVHSLLLILLSSGANPSLPDHEGKFPLNRLLSLHVFHHDPLQVTSITHGLRPYLITMATLASAMTTDALNAVVGGYKRSGFCGLICARQCPVYRLLAKYHEQPPSLKHSARSVIRGSLVNGFRSAGEELPLPTELKRFLLCFEIDESQFGAVDAEDQ